MHESPAQSTVMPSSMFVILTRTAAATVTEKTDWGRRARSPVLRSVAIALLTDLRLVLRFGFG